MSAVNRLLVVCGVLLSLLVVSGLVGWQELQLSRSETIYLPLAPVDPRSLVQGDFMRLRYAIEDDLRAASSPSNTNPYEIPQRSEAAIVTLDDRKIATFARIDSGGALASNERKIDFVQRDWEVIVASRGYLFQEGTAEVYEPAKYGVMALTEGGGLALTGLADEALHRLGPPPRRW